MNSIIHTLYVRCIYWNAIKLWFTNLLVSVQSNGARLDDLPTKIRADRVYAETLSTLRLIKDARQDLIDESLFINHIMSCIFYDLKSKRDVRRMMWEEQ